MTHPLSEELRTLVADSRGPYSNHRERVLEEALRRAAEALDAAALGETCLKIERDELRADLVIVKREAAHAKACLEALSYERDELRRRMRAEETDKWIDLHASASERAERAEAQAAAFRSWAKANLPEMECGGDEDCDHCVLAAILREPETGGKT